MSAQTARGPIVIDADVYGAGLEAGCNVGALRRNWGPSRMLKLEARIKWAEVVHSGPELVLVYAQLRVDCERMGHALSQQTTTPIDGWPQPRCVLASRSFSNDGIFVNAPGLELETVDHRER